MSEIIYRNKNAVAILRVSSRRQKDGISHAVQEERIREYCKENRLSLKEAFTITESAKNSEDRTHYHEAMEFVRKHKHGNVLFYMQDRESRNFTDLEANEKAVLNGEFNIHYVADRKIIHRDSPESDFLTRDFGGIMARGYIRTLRNRVNDAMARKAETGWYPSNNPPLGYVCQKAVDPETGRIKNRGGTIALDPNVNNRRIVLREFELRAEGISYEKIRQTLIQEGLVTGIKAHQYRAGAIEHRLKNPFYRGKFYWKDKLYDGKHEIFVPKELMDRVDAMNGLRGPALRREETDHTVLAGGWLKCECGCHVVYDPKTKTNKTTGATKTYHYYRCSNGKKAHPKTANILDEKIWEQFGVLMDQMTISKEFAEDIANALNEMEQKARKVTHMQIAELKEKEKELQKNEDTLFDFLLAKQIDKSDFDKQIGRIRLNRDSLTDQLEVLQNSLTSVVFETAKSILELATSAKSLWITRSAQERREFLNKILSNPVLEGLTVRYELKKPFAVLVKMAGNEKWRTLRDSNSRPIGSKLSSLSSYKIK